MTRSLIAIVLLLLPLTHVSAADSTAPDFARDIRPLLSNHCFHCHGPDDETREADLRLDTQEGLDSVFDADDPASSEILVRILSDDEDTVMPPAAANKPLSPSQVQQLQRWIETGADWQQHWSFVAPEKSTVPADESGWARNEIDAFALQRMQATGLQPSSEADPWTLIRRLYLDLTGLPPTPQEAETWTARIWPGADLSQPVSLREQTNEDQWQELITTLLNSPAWAERWARRWLDLARYADTNGYEKDRDRSIWPWRDWVIDALNAGMPFDQFTIEQIAGDMLPQASQQQRVATGFHRNTMLNEEGGIDPLEFRFHAMTDRVATTGTTWLGLTLGSVQCHAHKYDPISHDEYYRFMALLNNADEPTLRLVKDDTDATNDQRQADAAQLIAELADAWPVPDAFSEVRTQPTNVTAGPGSSEINDDGSILIPSTADQGTWEVRLRVFDDFDRIVLQGTTPKGRKGPGNTEHGNFVITDLEVFRVAADDTLEPLTITAVQASVEQSGFSASHLTDDDPKSGWAVDAEDGPVATSPQAVLTLSDPPTASAEHPAELVVRLHQNYGSSHTLRSFRLFAAQQNQQSREQHLQQAFTSWLDDQRQSAVDWTVLTPTAVQSSLPILQIESDGAIFSSGDTAKRDEFHITLPPSPEPVTAVRLEVLPDERLPEGGPGTTYYEGTIGDFFLNEITFASGDDSLPVAESSLCFAKDRYGKPSSAALTVDGDVQTGWSVHERQGERHTAVYQFETPVPANTAFEVHMIFGRHFASSLGRFRFSAASSDRHPVAHTRPDSVNQLLLKSPEQRTQSETAELRRAFLLQAPQLGAQQKEIRRLQKPAPVPTTLIMAERPDQFPRPTWRHHRGEFLQPKERVQPGVLSVLPPLPDGVEADRLALARWLVSNDNPLTARVVINRHWEAFFGTGIVRTVEDFGLQGEFPSHPQLLDWLAVTFVEDDHWSLRALHRRIVSSSLYRQSAAVPPQSIDVDPDNRLLSHSPRFRLDAEIVRDRLLVASGVLDPAVGGPSVRPPQPAGASEGAYRGSNWKPSEGTQRYRRSLYTFARRTAPFAMLTTFDAPTGEACIARRNRSNNPLQALTLLNDVMFTDLARHAGKAMLVEDNDDTHRATQLFRRVLVRPPSASELNSVLGWVRTQRDTYSSHPDRAQQLTGADSTNESDVDIIEWAVWTGTARTLFALDETVMRE